VLACSSGANWPRAAQWSATAVEAGRKLANIPPPVGYDDFESDSLTAGARRCAFCGAGYIVATGSKKLFCSDTCVTRDARRAGEVIPGITSRTCGWCGGPMAPGRRRFCSERCWRETRAERQRGQQQEAKETRPERPCSACGALMAPTVHPLRRFCDGCRSRGFGSWRGCAGHYSHAP
jgi:predicted nucleic acid-binding Zn ribbon protein